MSNNKPSFTQSNGVRPEELDEMAALAAKVRELETALEEVRANERARLRKFRHEILIAVEVLVGMEPVGDSYLDEISQIHAEAKKFIPPRTAEGTRTRVPTEQELVAAKGALEQILAKWASEVSVHKHLSQAEYVEQGLATQDAEMAEAEKYPEALASLPPNELEYYHQAKSIRRKCISEYAQLKRAEIAARRAIHATQVVLERGAAVGVLGAALGTAYYATKTALYLEHKHSYDTFMELEKLTMCALDYVKRRHERMLEQAARSKSSRGAASRSEHDGTSAVLGATSGGRSGYVGADNDSPVYEPFDEHYLDPFEHTFVEVNVSTGLTMIGNTGIDVGGNPFGSGGFGW